MAVQGYLLGGEDEANVGWRLTGRVVVRHGGSVRSMGVILMERSIRAGKRGQEEKGWRERDLGWSRGEEGHLG